jgi:cytochrome P450
MSDFRRDQLGFLVENMIQYGDIFHFRLLSYHIYLIAQPDAIQEVLVTQRERFEKNALDKLILGKFLGKGLLTNDGEAHKQQRKLVQPAFHSKRIEAYAEVMVNYTLQMLDDWRDGQVHDMDDEMMKLTMAIVSKTLFDAEVGEAADKVGQAIHTLQEISNNEYKTAFSIPDWLPVERTRKRKAARDVLDSVVKAFIAERRATGEDRGDLLSMLLLSEDEDGQRMSDQQVRDEAVTLFAAGHETTSNALTWTWYLLSQNPDVEAKLHEEVDTVLVGKPPTLQDLRRLPYTQMVLKESMRIYPPAWILNGRTAIEQVEIGGYTLAKGEQAWISPYAMHHNPRYFADPERFDPQRFSEENEKNIPRYAYLPFGGGPRVCIGNSFAMMEAQLILATMAQRFSFALKPGHIVEPQPLITMSPKYGMPMVVSVQERISEAVS